MEEGKGARTHLCEKGRREEEKKASAKRFWKQRSYPPIWFL